MRNTFAERARDPQRRNTYVAHCKVLGIPPTDRYPAAGSSGAAHLQAQGKAIPRRVADPRNTRRAHDNALAAARGEVVNDGVTIIDTTAEVISQEGAAESWPRQE